MPNNLSRRLRFIGIKKLRKVKMNILRVKRKIKMKIKWMIVLKAIKNRKLLKRKKSLKIVEIFKKLECMRRCLGNKNRWSKESSKEKKKGLLLKKNS